MQMMFNCFATAFVFISCIPSAMLSSTLKRKDCEVSVFLLLSCSLNVQDEIQAFDLHDTPQKKIATFELNQSTLQRDRGVTLQRDRVAALKRARTRRRLERTVNWNHLNLLLPVLITTGVCNLPVDAFITDAMCDVVNSCAMDEPPVPGTELEWFSPSIVCGMTVLGGSGQFVIHDSGDDSQQVWVYNDPSPQIQSTQCVRITRPRFSCTHNALLILKKL